jgi:acyl dehydratase
MPVTMELVEEIRRHVGASSPPIRATIDALTVQRYARAIGEDNALYFDEEYAKSKGYEGVVVPPNLLPSYLDWTDGGPEESLRPDGTPAGEMEWIPTEGVRIMGGGEEMHFHAPCIAGTEVVLASHLDEVTSRESKSGLMVVLKIRHTYETSDGELLMTSVRTVLGR